MANSENLPPPKLIIPRDEAKKKLQAQLSKGYELQEREINSFDELHVAQSERQRWRDYTTEILRRIFDNPSESTQFDRRLGLVGTIAGRLDSSVTAFSRETTQLVTRLQSIYDRLELIPESNDHSTSSNQRREFGNDIFIVHGHDEAAKQTVARFIERLGLPAKILHEIPNKGRTIIEKFEQEAKHIGFAVVLLTPDDTCNVGDNKVKRARQNVIFELGFFFAQLGRERVCALLKDDVEKPSDIDGVNIFLWTITTVGR